MSAIGSYNYRLAKLLANKIQPLRKRKHMLKDTLEFIEYIKKFDPSMTKHKMMSFDITSLFTKVSLAYTIKLILDQMYGPKHDCPKLIKLRNDWCLKCLDRSDMNKLLDMATLDTFFLQ